MLIAQRLFGEQYGAPAGAAAFIGHLYPVWLGFRGGKGVATFLGVLIGLQFWPAAIGYALIWILLLVMIRISSIAGMSAAISAPIVAYFVEPSLFPMLLGFTVLVLWKHRENILRLKAGSEPRVGRTNG